MIRFLKHLIQLVISPGRGWEDISYAGDKPEAIANDGLYPLFGLASLSAFVRYFYSDSIGLIDMLLLALAIFLQYFVSYFAATFLLSSLAKKYVENEEPNEKKVMTTVSYSLAIMAIITIIENCLPMELSVVQFLPLYVAVVVWKGATYMAIKEAYVGHYMLVAILALIAIPIAMGYVLQAII